MNSYYDEIIETIRRAVDQKDWMTAEVLLRQELAVPYIPEDYENEFHRLFKEVIRGKAEEQKPAEMPLDNLLEQLKKTPREQLSAAAELASRNLRSCTEEIREYLSAEPYPDAAALLIEALAEQEIAEEFTLNKEGVTYEFYPDDVTVPSQCEGFLEGIRLLETIYGNDRPDVLNMCRTLLVHAVYRNLPLTYEKEEAPWLLKEIIASVSDMLGDESIRTEADKVLSGN
ncbi:MAG: DUF3196 family protein [Solobacterium sp.]|nr:DUF3196 family protein [Solobacterium sp.]